MKITVLGKPRYLSPIDRTIDDSARVPAHIVRNSRHLVIEPHFETAITRDKEQSQCHQGA